MTTAKIAQSDCAVKLLTIEAERADPDQATTPEETTMTRTIRVFLNPCADETVPHRSTIKAIVATVPGAQVRFLDHRGSDPMSRGIRDACIIFPARDRAVGLEAGHHLVEQIAARCGDPFRQSARVEDIT